MSIDDKNQEFELIMKTSDGDEILKNSDTVLVRFGPKRNGIVSSWLNGGYNEDLSAVFNHPKDRKRMAVTAENSKEAITHVRVVKRFKGYTLVSCILETGRTHQIRVHMNYIGYPIYNDPVYNTKSSTEFGQFLHSYKMDFIHPITKKEMHFEAPLPKYFKDFIDSLEEL